MIKQNKMPLIVLCIVAVQIFALISLIGNDCAPIKESKRIIFKFFLGIVVLKLFYQFADLSIEFFEDVDIPTEFETYALFVFNIMMAYSQLMLAVDRTASLFVPVLVCSTSFIAIVSKIVPLDYSYVILPISSGIVTLCCFVSCNFEVSCIFLVYCFCFVFRMWFKSVVVLLVLHTILWFGVLIWFLHDRRRSDATVIVEEISEDGIRMINLS